MKKVFWLLALVLITAAMAFAGGNGEAPEEEGDINLHIFHFKVNIPWNEMTDSYAAQHPGIVFTNEIRGGGAQWMTILKSKFAANAAPDVFVVEGPGQAAVFEEYLSDLSDQPWVPRAVPFAREGLRIDGEIKGMPINLEGYGYIYNKAYFRDAGITQVPRTFSELRDAAEKLQAAGYTPFGTGYGEWWVVGLHLMNVPFAMQDDPQGFLDGLMAGTETMAGNPRFEELKNIMDLNVEFGERNPLTTANNEQTTLFSSGEVAMMQQGNWKEIVITDADPDMEVGVFPIPLNDNMEMSNRLPIGVPFYFVVNNSSPVRDQEAAKEFLNWNVSSDEGKMWITERFGYIPAYGDIEPVGLGGISADLLNAAAEDRAVPWMFGQFPDGMPQEFAANMQAYVGGQKTWDEVLEEVDAQWQRLK
jgi:raffinose/stachyose/melibiose transport system substrate-binding protein